MGLLDGLTSYGDDDFSRFLRGVFLASAGHDESDLGRPIIGIGHTISDYTTCHRDMPGLVAAISRGVSEAGGVPMVFPTMSLPEALTEPTTMLYRNLLAMETEEVVRSQPMDAVVLVGGCDKTVPAQIMAAVSADIPYIQAVVGPMMTSTWRGERLGACTDCRRLWSRYRAGELDSDDVAEVRERLATTSGTCMVMGTASSMAVLAEVLGVMVGHAATAPSPSGDRLRVGLRTGRAAVQAAVQQRRPSTYLTRHSLWNATVALAAIGGSTNAVVHLLAIAGRSGITFDLDDVAEILAEVPVVVDVKPSGEGYIEDFHAAGGVPRLLWEIREFLQADPRMVDGSALSDHIRPPSRGSATRVIRPVSDPVSGPGGLRVLRGSLAPRGALIKVAAASPSLLRHVGRAVVFESSADASARVDDPNLDVTANSVLVLRNIGPVGAGMPEAGSMPIPAKLARAGVRDMVRVSDGRMSGTSFGTVVLHVVPEAAVGGPLGLVRDGDEVSLDVGSGRIDLRVDDRELSRRKSEWRPPEPFERGWRRLYARTVLQADLGADLDFLAGPRTAQ